jgi:hypothetical protein
MSELFIFLIHKFCTFCISEPLPSEFISFESSAFLSSGEIMVSAAMHILAARRKVWCWPRWLIQSVGSWEKIATVQQIKIIGTGY